MSKVITLRLSQDEYEKISAAADIERRPVSNFITTRVLTGYRRFLLCGFN